MTIDWDRVAADLDDLGIAPTGRLLDDAECDGLVALDEWLERCHDAA